MAKAGRPRTPSGAFAEGSQYLQSFIEDKRASIEETQKFKGALKEWNKTIAAEQEDIEIEQILTDPYFLGTFKIWPAVQEDLCRIWHMRCDFHVYFMRCEVPGDKKTAKAIKKVDVYALSHEHAQRKAIRQQPSHYQECDFIEIRRDRDIHTVCIETPKGSGKDFEMSLAIWVLTREFLIQNRAEMMAPYELDANTFISINLTNRTETQARSVTFREVLPKFNVPFFNDYFPPQISIEKIMEDRVYPAELRFPKNTVLFAGTGSASTGLGYTLAALVMDECNFMTKSASGTRGMSGDDEYDAAKETYRDGKDRLFSRFSCFRNGKQVTPGLIIPISSTRTNRDFTSWIETIAESDPGIHYVSNFFWERKPLGLSGETFEFDTRTMSVVNDAEAKTRFASIDVKPELLEQD